MPWWCYNEVDRTSTPLKATRLSLKKDSKVVIAVAGFSIYAYDELKLSLNKLLVKLLFTLPTFTPEKT